MKRHSTFKTYTDAVRLQENITMKDEWKVGRVIARPYVGKKKGEFKRTSNRHELCLKAFWKDCS